MTDMLDIIMDYFMEKGWPFTKHDERQILRLEYVGENGDWILYARAREDTGQFIFLSVLSEKVPENKRPAVAEFLTRANFGLNIGNFEMDFSDGEVRYKTSIDVTHDRLTSGLIDSLVIGNLVSMDDYLPGINSVTAGKETPSEAIERIHKEP